MECTVVFFIVIICRRCIFFIKSVVHLRTGYILCQAWACIPTPENQNAQTGRPLFAYQLRFVRTSTPTWSSDWSSDSLESPNPVLNTANEMWHYFLQKMHRGAISMAHSASKKLQLRTKGHNVKSWNPHWPNYGSTDVELFLTSHLSHSERMHPFSYQRADTYKTHFFAHYRWLQRVPTASTDSTSLSVGSFEHRIVPWRPSQCVFVCGLQAPPVCS